MLLCIDELSLTEVVHEVNRLRSEVDIVLGDVRRGHSDSEALDLLWRGVLGEHDGEGDHVLLHDELVLGDLSNGGLELEYSILIHLLEGA